MRLADFILRDAEAILVQWEAFASAQLPAAASMKSLALREHAQQILEAVAKDIRSPQSDDERVEKSRGRAPQLIDAPETAAQMHAILRARSGFDINQMAAEYRALRASVLHLWAQADRPDSTDLQDTIRFNEAIDQALAESIAFFSAEVDQARNLFLGMLGHDMRNPLQVIQVTAAYLGRLNAGVDVSAAATRLVNSGARLKALLDDLLDFNRIKLGLGINIAPSAFDLADVLADELQQIRVAHPGRQIELELTGDMRGVWDANRLHQLLCNLVLNALTYGALDAPVRVVVAGMQSEVVIAVKNRGPMIERSTLHQIFDPLTRGPENQDGPGPHGSLGLGLYICRGIVTAHGGDISAQSDETETVFIVRLPRMGRRALASHAPIVTPSRDMVNVS